MTDNMVYKLQKKMIFEKWQVFQKMIKYNLSYFTFDLPNLANILNEMCEMFKVEYQQKVDKDYTFLLINLLFEVFRF